MHKISHAGEKLIVFAKKRLKQDICHPYHVLPDGHPERLQSVKRPSFVS